MIIGEQKISTVKNFKKMSFENRILELRTGANSWNILDITLENGRKSHIAIPYFNSY